MICCNPRDVIGLWTLATVFENHRKSLIGHCEQSELRIHFEWTKMPKMVHFGEFLNSKACSQTVLPDRSVLIRQKLVEVAKIQKFKCDILINF